MHNSADEQIIAIPQPEKRGRGRPVTGHAMTNAERQRRYRQNLKSSKRSVTKNQGSEKGARVCDAIDLQGSDDFLLTSLAQLEQQVTHLFERERHALSEVARLQALIAAPMPGQMKQGELKDFEIQDLRNRCRRYEKLLDEAYRRIDNLEQRLSEHKAGV
ncbi:MAG: hypothetical protein ACXV7J_13040 [Methylomonas sp.]